MRHSILILASICVLSSGCASMFMNGGKLVDAHYKPAVKASYRAETCTTKEGTSVPGPPVTFQLVQEGPITGIFERSPDGSGAVITNHWSDDKGDHYFGWVQSTGWEYVMPKDPAAPATRLVYVGLQRSEEGGVTKPTSAVGATCALVVAK
jgi:hypothetical protein